MKVTALLLSAALFILTACHSKKPAPVSAIPESSRLEVYVANYPLKYFTERLAGQEVDIVFPAPKDQDPAFWQPTDAQITDFQRADLIVMNGATYSKWAEKVTLPEDRIVDTSLGFKDRFIVIKNAVTHSHGKQGMHSHDGTSFTTWIDFQQAILQADTLDEALKRLKSESIELFAQDFDLLKKDLLALDTRMEAVGKKLAGRPLVASHPIYQYWARRYHINLQHVLWEPEEVPTDAQMNDLKAILASHPAKWMVWEGEPAKESVEKLKAIGVSSAVFDPCANTPDKGDFLSFMKANVANMEKLASALDEDVKRN
jgi:zinc transport system substrate-binding protein